MAAANPFEDEFGCSVCFDVFQEPHILKECLHTFCLKCIKQLEERGRVQCPECRQFTNSRDVKKDFKMQRFIDLQNTLQTQGFIGGQPNTQICGMCEEPNRPVISHCEECNFFICSGCVNGHKKSIALKSHTVKSITVIIGQHQSSLNKTTSELKIEVRNIDRELNNVSRNIQEVQKSNTRNIDDVKTFTEDRVKALKDNEKTMEKLINDASDNLVKHLNKRRQMLNKQKKDIQSKIELLEDLVKSQDVSTLHEKANNLNHAIQNDIRKIKISLSHNSGHMKSNVNVQKGENWDVTKCIKVNFGDVMCNIQQIEPVLKPMYSELYNNNYKLDKQLLLDDYLYKLCLNNNQLWCAGENSLYVYDKDCKLVKQVKYDKIRGSVSLAVSQTGYIIVACYNQGGLHQLNTTGLYHSQIAEGSFSDVVCYNGDIYALEYNHCKVVVFRKNDTENRWSQYKLQHSNGSTLDRLCVHKTGIYVSSFNNDCIYVYNIQGQFQYKIKEKEPGELNGPILCDVHSSGYMLVADWNNHRLQVYDNEGNWHVITLLGEWAKPVHAMLGYEGEIWMIQDGPPKALIKFIKY